MQKQGKVTCREISNRGLIISYSRVQEIQENITRQVCQQYLHKEIACRRNIEKE